MESDEFRDEMAVAASNLNASALSQFQLCDSCLGRLFAKVGRGVENRSRGIIARPLLNVVSPEKDSECFMCKGVASRVEMYAEQAINALAEWEYSSFLIGTKFEQEILASEETVWSEAGATLTEPIKAEMNREIGKLVEKMTGKEANFTKPDIIAVVDTTYESVEVQVSSVYFYGRYRKFSREIPQTRWPCRECRGRGCERCNDTGKMYQDSVEEFIGRHAVEITGGKDHRFHGMGREDIDALMLGNGRPFILEIKDPKIRTINYPKLQEKVNASTDKIEISELRPSDGDEVVRIKDARPNKSYRAHVVFSAPVNEENLKEVVVSLGGTSIAQQTPTRVIHRRSDMTRNRTVHKLEARMLNSLEAELDITAEAGTYIKEFVHGDGGRTVP
ncbi:MAG: tRNA pseudouridine(54/55) synthase Pus10, partial [Candidatus Thermoplasmatota archaeon]|nr:tRNA pseudouridine(54/55) synthase Pus10 [Candidatus Thermoplasmatota archaeon]